MIIKNISLPLVSRKTVAPIPQRASLADVSVQRPYARARLVRTPVRTVAIGGLVLLVLSTASAAVRSQEYGATIRFRKPGLAYSSSGDVDHYLLWKRQYATEDPIGYEGRIRIRRHAVEGSTSDRLEFFVARCKAQDDRKMIGLSPKKDGAYAYFALASDISRVPKDVLDLWQSVCTYRRQ